MTCICCAYEWCWICRKEYNSSHFSYGGECEGLSYADLNSFRVKHPKLYDLVFRILKMMLFFVAFPLFFIYIVADKFVGDIIHFRIGTEILTAFFILEICILFYPLLLSLSSIILITMIFYWPFQRKMLREFFR